MVYKLEVIETDGQEEKEEAVCPGAGHLSTRTGTLGAFPGF